MHDAGHQRNVRQGYTKKFLSHFRKHIRNFLEGGKTSPWDASGIQQRGRFGDSSNSCKEKNKIKTAVEISSKTYHKERQSVSSKLEFTGADIKREQSLTEKEQKYHVSDIFNLQPLHVFDLQEKNEWH